jgi:hypothetical protein
LAANDGDERTGVSVSRHCQNFASTQYDVVPVRHETIHWLLDHAKTLQRQVVLPRVVVPMFGEAFDLLLENHDKR